MLEIPTSEVHKIAQMPTEHSWLREIMLLNTEEMDQKEWKILDWIEKEGEKLQKDSQVGRIARTTYINLLEAEAINLYVQQNPQMMGYLVPAWSPSQAAILGAMDVMYVSEKEKELAAQLLQRLQEMTSSPV